MPIKHDGRVDDLHDQIEHTLMASEEFHSVHKVSMKRCYPPHPRRPRTFGSGQVGGSGAAAAGRRAHYPAVPYPSLLCQAQDTGWAHR
jgi:hypothetical protein